MAGRPETNTVGEEPSAMGHAKQVLENQMQCEICGRTLNCWSWTDTHGVAQHATCGTPFRIYHYDDDNKPVDKPPEIRVVEEYIPVLKAYWDECQRIIPGCHSFPGGQEMASDEDVQAFNEWMAVNAEKHKASADAH